MDEDLPAPTLLNMDVLYPDPLLEVVIDGIVFGAGTNLESGVEVELSLMPFMVEEGNDDEDQHYDQQTHQWFSSTNSSDFMDLDDGLNDDDKDDDSEVQQDLEEPVTDGISSAYDLGEGAYFENNEDQDSRFDDDEDNELNSSQYEHEEEEDGDGFRNSVAKSVFRNYGAIGWILYRNLVRMDIINSRITPASYFLHGLVEDFLLHLRQDGSLTAANHLATLMACIPPLADFHMIVRRAQYSLKEGAVIKVLLHLMELYYRRFGGPTFKIILEHVIPITQDFYGCLSDGAICIMNLQIRKILFGVKDYGGEFQLFNSKSEYSAHFRDLTRQLRNLCESNELFLYLR